MPEHVIAFVTAHLTSESSVVSVFPSLRGRKNLSFSEEVNIMHLHLRSFALLLCLLVSLPALAWLGAQPAIQPSGRHHPGPGRRPALGALQRRCRHRGLHGHDSPRRHRRSNAYFEGGYWLILWDFLYLLRHLSSAAANCAGRRACAIWPCASPASSRLQTFLYWVQYIVAHLRLRLSARVL